MAPPTPDGGPHWFPNARLNYAEHLVKHRDRATAIVAWTERGWTRSWTYAELFADVSRVTQGLRAIGVRKGDRVAAFMPNVGETIIAMIATTALGAIWTSCSPDFGNKGVLDRFSQVEPKVLITTDGYRYAGKVIETLSRACEIRAELPTVEHLVVVPYVKAEPSLRGIDDAIAWRDLGRDEPDDLFPVMRLPFDHPLFIMYSSGTTGLPKCMVHGHGGTLLQHLKEHQLHADVRPRRVGMFYFTTCGWMMWNWLVSPRSPSGATLMRLRRVAPFIAARVLHPLFDYCAAEERLHASRGVSAKFIARASRSSRSNPPAATTRFLGTAYGAVQHGQPCCCPRAFVLIGC